MGFAQVRYRGLLEPAVHLSLLGLAYNMHRSLKLTSLTPTVASMGPRSRSLTTQTERKPPANPRSANYDDSLQGG